MNLAHLEATLRAAGCVYAEEEAALLSSVAADSDDLARLVRARCAGAPLETLVGFVDFGGLRLTVAPGVFVPRQRTVALARAAAARAVPGALVVDLCCGVGAVGAVVRDSVPVRLVAVDLDPVAAECARANLPGAEVLVGDLFEPLDPALRGSVDVLVCNAPYVPTGKIAELPREARDHEPRMALDGGADGLAVQNRVVAAAPLWLSPGGWLLIETSSAQAPALLAAFDAAGFDARVETEGEAVFVTGRTVSRVAGGPATAG